MARPIARRRFHNAISACAAGGGGRVVVPGGEFLTGPIHLKSNVDLHLAATQFRFEIQHRPGRVSARRVHAL